MGPAGFERRTSGVDCRKHPMRSPVSAGQVLVSTPCILPTNAVKTRCHSVQPHRKLHEHATPLAAVTTAAAAHHADLRTRLTKHTNALVAAVATRTGHESAQRTLVDFLRTELLPHVRMEETLLYAAVGTEQTALLVRAMEDEHRKIVGLIDEVEQAGNGTDVAVAAGALAALCDVRIEQENRHLLPALAEAGVDLSALLTDSPEIVGDTAARMA